MIKVIFFDFYGVINIDEQPNREIIEFLQANNDKYLFGILSAANIDLHDWLITHGINDYFALVQTTGKLGMSKSSEGFYIKALEVLSVKANSVIFVDDVSEYVEIARGIGMHGIVYDSRHNFLSLIQPLLG